MPEFEATANTPWGMTDAERAVVESFREQAREYVRCIVGYEDAAWSIMYLREDVRRRTIVPEVEELLPHVQRDRSEDARRDVTFARINGVVRFFEDAVALSIPLRETWSLFVIMEPEAGVQVFELARDHMHTPRAD